MAAQDPTAKMRNWMYRYMNAVTSLMQARETLRGVATEWVDNGYNPGITQALIIDPGLVHLTPLILANGMNAQVQLENLMQNAVVTQGAWGVNLDLIIGT
jgi:hypothetical protein